MATLEQVELNANAVMKPELTTNEFWRAIRR